MVMIIFGVLLAIFVESAATLKSVQVRYNTNEEKEEEDTDSYERLCDGRGG